MQPVKQITWESVPIRSVKRSKPSEPLPIISGSFDAIENFLLENVQSGDLLLTMGAGDVYQIGEHILGK